LENLKAGKYLLIALKDLNNNKQFEERKDLSNILSPFPMIPYMN
jgi:hypothetical protein